MDLRELFKLMKKPSFWLDGLALVAMFATLYLLYLILWACFEAPEIV